jgi:phenylpropionate dioxygenase-like ring-hydroxylating dioxygenase large terminal subunit
VETTESEAAKTGYDTSQYPVAPSAVDAGHYRDPAQYEREVSRILLRSWLMACPAGALAKARDFLVWEHLGQSVMIVRLDDGGLAAWHNVCQHRGARIVDERSGQCPLGAFRCPWHGFTYDLEGRVVHTPLREAFDEQRLEGLRAPEVRVREWSGFVWLALDGEAPPLEHYLGDLAPEVDGYGFAEWEAPFSHQWTIEANWKTVIDAFNETWHVPFTHRDTVRGGLLWRDAQLRFFGAHSMMAIPLRKPAGEAPRQRLLNHYLAFPNTIFNCLPTLMQAFSAWPAGPRTTVLTAWGLNRPPADGTSRDEWEARAARDWEHYKAVVEEDKVVLESAGRVYDSLGFRRNLFNAAEGRLTAFHEHINQIAG